MRVQTCLLSQVTLTAPVAAPTARGDRFTPSNPDDLQDLTRQLTASAPVPAIPRTHKSEHTNLRGRPWVDAAGVTHLVQGQSLLRVGPGGEALDPLQLPREPHVWGAGHCPDGTIYYLSEQGTAVAVRGGKTLFDVPVGGWKGRITPDLDGNFLTSVNQTVTRLSPSGEVLGQWELPLGEETTLASVTPGPEGSFFARASDGRVLGCNASGDPQWEKQFKNFGQHPSVQLSRDGRTLFVNGAHKQLVGIDARTGEPNFNYPLGKEEGYWSCSPWVEFEDGRRMILTEGGKILHFDVQGQELDRVDTGTSWGQINGAVPVFERAQDNLCVMPSVGTFQIYSLDGFRRAEYKCGEVFRPADYLHSAAVGSDRAVLAAGSFGLASIGFPRTPQASASQSTGEVKEQGQAILVGGVALRKRS